MENADQKPKHNKWNFVSVHVLIIGYFHLARILKMSVQNRIHKFSARPDLAIQLLQILIPTTLE